MFARTLKTKLILLAALVVGSVGSAQAIPAYWDDLLIDPVKVSVGNSYSYSHNITGGAFGYQSGQDSIFYALLTIGLIDDQFFDGKETVSLRFDNSGWTGAQNVHLLHFFDVTSFLADGLLNVVVKANSGDFYFGGSFLQAWGSRSNSVPEPATLTLFGFGLLAAGLAARRRRGAQAS